MPKSYQKTLATKGFTIIELMTTVVIIGIVAAMAVPRFDAAFERVRFRSANRNMVSALRVARSMAITSKVQHGVFFDGSHMTVAVFRDVINPGSYTFDGSDSVVSVDTLTREFDYLGTNLDGNVIVFGPNGAAHFTALGGGGAEIISLVASEHTVAIQTHSVLASTGRISSYSHYY